MTTLENAATEAPAPWWKFGHVWLVVSGPLVVVVASFITLYLAVTRPDPVVSENYYQQGININQTRQAGQDASLAPAMKARNHAATGVVPEPRQVTKP
jgi:hypothetical protein